MKLHRRSFFAAIAAAFTVRKLPAIETRKKSLSDTAAAAHLAELRADFRDGLHEYALSFEVQGAAADLLGPFYPGKVIEIAPPGDPDPWGTYRKWERNLLEAQRARQDELVRSVFEAPF